MEHIEPNTGASAQVETTAPQPLFDKRYRNSIYLKPMNEAELAAFHAKKMEMPGFVVLAREPGANDWRGIVEGSFSLDLSRDRTQFFWSSQNATSNFGGSFVVDGRKDAEAEIAYWSKKHPDWEFQIFDARDDANLPVHLDWDMWVNGCRPADTLSGVNNKYDARNLRFLSK